MDTVKQIDTKASTGLPASIEYLVVDSRKIIFPKTSLFFALTGPRRDGHSFVGEAYQRGVRHFVVSQPVDEALYPDANFLIVSDVLKMMQTLVGIHRAGFDYPVIGITGSNGKTIVKEWLYQLLNPDYNIVRSPRSYNSQIGVPLSVWQMNKQHTLGIFEAGISTSGEMPALAAIIQPTIGILTNIGEAHSEGYLDNKQKALEKLQLFSLCKHLIYYIDSVGEVLDIAANKHLLFHQKIELFSWGREQPATLRIIAELEAGTKTQAMMMYKGKPYTVNIPFTDKASLDNAYTCISAMLLLGIPFETIQARVQHLQHLEMRLQLKKGINNCHVLNDSYSNDLSSLGLALDYLQQQAGNSPTTVILSDIFQAGIPDSELYQLVAEELEQRDVNRLIGIGKGIGEQQHLFHALPSKEFYPTTEDFLQIHPDHPVALFKDEYILLKGARPFAFERINQWLEEKVHQTVMEINLTAMAHNLKQYQQKLLPTTKLMAMVKAFSYGSGSLEVARVLQFHKVDYLAVAYTDEGVELRKGGISLPIMVMNAERAGFDALIEHSLEPEIYSFALYNQFHEYLLNEGISKFPVHIKVNTGMNRLGFEPEEIPVLIKQLALHSTMAVKSIFSHLVGSEAAEHDGFTQHQASLFIQAADVLQSVLPYTFMRHIANSSGIFRHPHLQYDMVRLGIGLYGVDSAKSTDIHLQPVATLKSTIAQIRHVKANDTIGYNRRGKLDRDSIIGTIRIGYADGFSRKLGNGVGKVYLHGQLAPVVGSVCMDMLMVDLTDIPDAKEGDTVEIFGSHLPIQQVAEWEGTIAYEIMTGISQRVKRVYVEE
ncbi:bifunctional UDP-N-acetylmuramoyl-tripeptide:D-alanyl-D-alanine ligase/alanine racemase [Parasediminibacterium sp. JCM 36343]|uniref:bifunctional UDP-N-acetylmuramoyl-tripeptide:D-alanyl-D-alanine ligase/alanine racemase n=1 Tax=Parasediminibacterium sp. JCM 36343 TaxID=3374279 RepID=UPI00397D5C82